MHSLGAKALALRGALDCWSSYDVGCLEAAQVCARDLRAEPAALVRAARDFDAKEPKFAAEIGVVALVRLLSGSGYDPEVFFFQAEDGIRDYKVTGVQTCALPI